MQEQVFARDNHLAETQVQLLQKKDMMQSGIRKEFSSESSDEVQRAIYDVDSAEDLSLSSAFTGK